MKVCRDIEFFKASSVDGLPSRVFKDAFLILSKQLTYCYKISLISGIFPQAWKEGKVIPLFKGGDASSVGNYRAPVDWAHVRLGPDDWAQPVSRLGPASWSVGPTLRRLGPPPWRATSYPRGVGLPTVKRHSLGLQIII